MKPNKEIFIKQLPKVVNSIIFLQFVILRFLILFVFRQELHAHINGSLSNETLGKLSQLKYGTGAKHTEQYNMFTKLDLNE